jgi:beta-lactamase regulating signal transducer with metallopeptidase domain
MRENRSKLIFILCTLLPVTLLLQMGLYVLHAMTNWGTSHNLVQLCDSLLQSLGITYAGYALTAVILQTFLLIAVTVSRQAVLSVRFNRELRACEEAELTREINRRFGIAGGAITVIRNPAPLAMAAGLFKPRIVLSTGLLQLLSRSELRAVLHHEWYHAKSADPLKTFLLTLFAASMWYIPILKWSLRNYKIVREVLADHYAIHRMGTSAELGSALLKLLKTGIPARMPVTHVSITDASINYRIRQIVEPQTKLKLNWPWGPVIISVQVVTLLCSLLIITM